MSSDLKAAIERARVAAGVSQRELSTRTGISQPTLSRIVAGDRPAKMSEVMLIADATGHTVAQLTGSAVSDRVECAARASNGSPMEGMRRQLVNFMELDAYLDDQGISQAQ